jgi:hypothetical protein
MRWSVLPDRSSREQNSDNQHIAPQKRLTGNGQKKRSADA